MIATRDVRVIWIGGGAWPVGGRDTNLGNDIAAANVMARSGIEIWQVPMPVYRHLAVSHAELSERLSDSGAVGRYLVELVIGWNATLEYAIEHRSLGDTAAVGIMMDPECGVFEWAPGPEYGKQMNYMHTGRNRPIRLYRDVDQRFILEDMFAKLARFARGEQPAGLA